VTSLRQHRVTIACFLLPFECRDSF